ncbi:hypothetical protein B0I35DRAFT_445223 [Stachybotrys elegans]|uniref:Uncharacterized protein n=1 Tax=Stachybotrys elegans TaxID=80388 RepID=A0A8K0WJL2_9HYPO|nr:hypothetical protein B0I35DRAFT_445223 [Stachybotrys elegans]
MNKTQTKAKTPLQRRPTLQGYGPASRTDTSGSPEDNFAPKRKDWSTLDADEIISKLNCHESFTLMEGHHLKDLPRFSDMANYQVSEAEQFDLWCFEVKRLIDTIKSKQPIDLEGPDEWFGQADEEAYLNLHKLATQLIYAINICVTDNELLLVEFEPMAANLDNYRASRTRLLKSFGPDGALHIGADSIRLTVENDRCFQALVNYITGTLAQVLLRVAEGEFWDTNVLIAVAKLSAKIKLVSFDLAKAAAISLAGAKDWEVRLARMQQNDFPAPSTKELSTGKDKQLYAAQREIGHEGGQYFRIMDTFQQCIDVLILRVAQGLAFDQAIDSGDAFEASSLIYDTGFLRQRTMLCQQRSGALGGSAHHTDIHCASFAFEVCLEVLEKLQKNRKPPKGSTSPYTSFYWKWTPILPTWSNNQRGVNGTAPLRDEPGSKSNENKKTDAIGLGTSRTGTLQLTSMKEIVTAYVPFIMLCGDFPSQLRAMLDNAHYIANPGETKTCKGEKFLASFALRTSKYQNVEDSDIKSVVVSDVARLRALSDWEQASSTGAQRFVSGDKLLDSPASHKGDASELQAANERISHGLRLIRGWIIDDRAIIVPYRWYCWGTLVGCGTLILGGLAIGFSVQERIRGVDPFNISVFCWALAGFLILYFKSIRVQEWPWRDFFLGRVVCRSVSEVVAVSAIDPQLLLSIFLYLEPVMNLQKRGPFGSIFARRDAENGFAIDVPLGTAATNEGGCFFVKVQSDTGPALVCLRLNYNGSYEDVEPRGNSAEGAEVKCRRLDTSWRWGEGPDEEPLYSLMTNSLTWTRVIGLHSANAAFD